MKRLFHFTRTLLASALLVSLAFGLSLSGIGTQIAQASLLEQQQAAGTLKAYWDFRTGSTRDITGNTTVTTVTGTPKYKTGRAGLGLSISKFDAGVSGLAITNANASITSGVFWIQFAQNQVAGAAGGSTSEVYYQGNNANMRISTANVIGIYSHGGTTGIKNSTYTLTDDKPHVYAVKFMSGVTNGTRFFVDGVFAGTVTWTPNGGTGITLGYTADGAAYSAGGTIYALAVSSDTTLTDAQIGQISQEIANGKSNLKATYTNLTYPYPKVPANETQPVIEYDMQTKNGAKLANLGSAGTSYDATFGTVPPWSVKGVFDKALGFKGVANNKLYTSAVTQMDGASKITVEAVATMADNAAAYPIYGWYSGSENDAFYLYYNNGSWKVSVSAGGASYGSCTYSIIGQNVHVRVEYDGSQSGNNAAALKFYINGVQQTLSFTGTIPAALNTEGVGIYTGTINGTSNYFNGNISYLRVWIAKVPTAAENTRHYNQFAQLLRYKLDMSAVPVTLANVTAGYIPGTEFNVTVGSMSVSQDTTTPFSKRLTSQGVNSVLNQKVNLSPFGTYFFHWKQSANSGYNYVTLLDNSLNGYGFASYQVGQIGIARFFVGSPNLYPCISATNYIAINVDYRFVITRTGASVFTLYIKGGAYTNWTLVSTVGGGGTNPFTDTSYTTGVKNLVFSASNAGKQMSGPTFFQDIIDPTTASGGAFIDALK